MKYEIKLYRVIIVLLLIAFIFVSAVSIKTSIDKNYANSIIDDGQQRISDLHIVINNQVEYYIFLQTILKNNNIDFDYYNYFVDNYINVN